MNYIKSHSSSRIISVYVYVICLFFTLSYYMASEHLKNCVSTVFMIHLRCLCVIYEPFRVKERKKNAAKFKFVLRSHTGLEWLGGEKVMRKTKDVRRKRQRVSFFTLDSSFTSIHDLRAAPCKRWYFMMFCSFIIIVALLGINQRGVIGKMRFKWVEGMFSRSLSVLLLKVGYMLLSVTIKLQLSAVWR